MTRWIRPGTVVVFSALFAIALAGCGSSSAGPAPLTTTPDASALPDAIGVADTSAWPGRDADVGLPLTSSPPCLQISASNHRVPAADSTILASDTPRSRLQPTNSSSPRTRIWSSHRQHFYSPCHDLRRRGNDDSDRDGQRSSLHLAARAVAPGVQCPGPDSDLTWAGLPRGDADPCR